MSVIRFLLVASSASVLLAALLLGPFATAQVINVPPDIAPDSVGTGETLNLGEGGGIRRFFNANDGSTVNISGGMFDDFFRANDGSTINIMGGTGNRIFRANSGSEVNISGGTVGSGFYAAPGSRIELTGGGFRRNGLEYTSSTISLGEGDVFTGTLADGSPLVFSKLSNDTMSGVTLTTAPLPELDTTPIIVNNAGSAPHGLRSGQSLTLQEDGELRANFAVLGATLNVEGGLVGDGLEVVDSLVNIVGGIVGSGLELYHGTTLNVEGGEIGAGLNANWGSQLNISGGMIGTNFLAGENSTVNISGGEFGGYSYAYPGSTVYVTGGTLGDFDIYANSDVTISGGSFGYGFTARRNSTVQISGGTFRFNFDSLPGSNVELVGGEFRLNGLEYTGSTISLDANDVFTGTLADGSAFLFTPLTQDLLSNVALTLATLPEKNLAPIIIGPSDAAPPGLRSSQSLTLQEGGKLGESFAVVDASLTIEGGSVGRNLEVARSVVEITGGEVDGVFSVYSGSTLNISGGTVGYSFHAHPGSAATISGGSFGNGFFAHSGSTVIIEGGSIGENFTALPGSWVQVSGGTFSRDFGAAIGSNVEFIGGEFKLNGVEFTNSTITLAPGDVFTGTLANGTPFVFSPLDQDALSGVTLVPAPLSGPDTTPMVISAAGSAPLGLRSGQLLTLQEGGVLDRNFAVVNATLLVEGGVVGHGLEVVNSIVSITGGEVKANLNAYAGSTINISGGKVGENSRKSADRIDAYAGSIINISGGEVIGRIGAHSESTINITGGEVEDRIEAFTDATVNISGGTVDRSLQARAGSTINVSGGNFIGETAYVGFTAFAGSEINLFGTEFVLDEVPLELELGVPMTITSRDVTLFGLLADGSPFSFDLNMRAELGDWFQSGATLTVNLVSGVAGDFNADSEVDGADFLAWQRGESPHPHTISDLDAWQENYGVGGANPAAEAAVIPEPWSGSLLFVAVVVLAMGYREPRSDSAIQATRGHLEVAI